MAGSLAWSGISQVDSKGEVELEDLRPFGGIRFVGVAVAAIRRQLEPLEAPRGERLGRTQLRQLRV